MKTKRFFAILLSAMLLLGMLVPGLIGAGAAADLSPGSLVTAGLYPQSRVTDPALLAQLDAAGPGDIKFNGVMYAPMDGEWFRFDPIEWRVLESDADTVLLLADKVLDAHAAATFTVSWAGEPIDVTSLNALFAWCEYEVSLRAFGPGINYWDYLQLIYPDIMVSVLGILNVPLSNFITVPLYGSVLTEAEARKPAYGFTNDQSRIAAPTDYAVAAGVYTDGSSARWWALNCTLLSSLANPATFGLGICVDYDGFIGYQAASSFPASRPARGFNAGYDDSRMGMRPVVKLKRADLNPPPATFHANGGENAPQPQPVHYGETLVLTAQEPVRQGWNFLGWSEDPDAQEPEHLPGHTWFGNPQILYGYEYTLYRPFDLYAVWERRLGPVNGVTITAPAGALPEEVTGMTAVKASPYNYRIQGSLLESWDIKLVPAGAQPKEGCYVIVRIPVPANTNPASLKVVYIKDPTLGPSSPTEEMESWLEEGEQYIAFKAYHFSLYALVDRSSGGGQTEDPDPWWAKLHPLLQWILRWLLFGWIWMQ